MLKVGKRQNLRVNNISKIGAYLDAETGDPADNVLLPNNQLENKNVEVDDIIEVYIYRDSEDRLIATFEYSKAQTGTICTLEVVDTTKFGAFLSGGLEKDILLARDQMNARVNIGDELLVGIYEDKRGRISATMNLHKFLLPCYDYEKNDFIKGTIYKIEREVGVFVAVDNRYYGLIPSNEYFKSFKVGDEIEARVIRVRDDYKLDLSPRKVAFEQIEGDAEEILATIKRMGGLIKLTDKSDPETIKSVFNISKKAFKRAIGNLLKNGLIEKTEDGFKLK